MSKSVLNQIREKVLKKALEEIGFHGIYMLFPYQNPKTKAIEWLKLSIKAKFINDIKDAS